VFFPIKEKVSPLGPKGATFFCVKNRSYFIKEGLSFGPIQNLEVTSDDSLAGSSTLQKGPVTAWHFWKEQLKSSAQEVIEKLGPSDMGQADPCHFWNLWISEIFGPRSDLRK
jgi:hypothetical protein